MSIPSSWRQFQLFEFTPIRDPNVESDDSLYSDSSLSSICATNKYLVIAVNNAYIKVINLDNLTLVRTFMAYDIDYRIGFIKRLEKSDLIVTLGEKQGSPSVIKLWDLNKIIHLETVEDSIFKFQTQVMVVNGDDSYPVSCFLFNFDLTCLAIGYTNGKVILVRGDLLRDRGSKQRVIYESNDPITGIHFNSIEDLLYVTTTSKILTIPTTGRNQGKPARILSNKTGIDLNCSDTDRDSLIVGTPDSIRFYNHIHKTNSFTFEVPKSKVHRVSKNSLLIVSSQDEDILTSSKKKLVTRILILDLKNKHISFNLVIPNNLVSNVFELQNDIYLLTNDGMLYKIHEKPINQQIEVILQRELFPIAYKLAEQAKMPKDVLLRIQNLYGEFLFNKQRFEDSIDVFIGCLDLFGEDKDDFIMNTIIKFKDVSNISNLTKFLYKLYEINIASNDHITLLLCCYCKLKLTDDLDKFILNFDDKFQDLNFQLIINLFKECGYFNQVIKLLYKLNQPSSIVDIQLNDLHKPKECLEYIKCLPIDDLLLILIDHSKSLLDYCPIETTELLINVFTGKYIPTETIKEPFLDSVCEETVLNPQLDLNSYTSFLSYLAGIKDESPTVSELPGPTYMPPRPSIIYPSFINHELEFVIFLEACVETFDKYQGNINDKKDLLITLLELYSSLERNGEGDEKEKEKEKEKDSKEKDKENGVKSDWYYKACKLIEINSTLLDSSSLLLLSHIYNFKEGEALAQEQNGYEESLFQSYKISGNIKACFDLVRKFGDKKPQLYKLMLKFIISKQDIFEQVKDSDFKFVLNKIDRNKIMSPLEILQILTSEQDNEFVTLGLVKDYLIDNIESQNNEINNNMKLIEYYEAESTKNSYKLTELTSKPFIIQNNKCSECSLKLDFPVVHFKCNHSYHQKCLNDSVYVSSDVTPNSFDRKCPKCINEIDEMNTIKNTHYRARDNVDYFENALRDSKDKYKFISDYMGKGIMENESITLQKD